MHFNIKKFYFYIFFYLTAAILPLVLAQKAEAITNLPVSLDPLANSEFTKGSGEIINFSLDIPPKKDYSCNDNKNTCRFQGNYFFGIGDGERGADNAAGEIEIDIDGKDCKVINNFNKIFTIETCERLTVGDGYNLKFKVNIDQIPYSFDGKYAFNLWAEIDYTDRTNQPSDTAYSNSLDFSISFKQLNLEVAPGNGIKVGSLEDNPSNAIVLDLGSNGTQLKDSLDNKTIRLDLSNLIPSLSNDFFGSDKTNIYRLEISHADSSEALFEQKIELRPNGTCNPDVGCSQENGQIKFSKTIALKDINDIVDQFLDDNPLAFALKARITSEQIYDEQKAYGYTDINSFNEKIFILKETEAETPNVSSKDCSENGFTINKITNPVYLGGTIDIQVNFPGEYRYYITNKFFEDQDPSKNISKTTCSVDNCTLKPLSVPKDIEQDLLKELRTLNIEISKDNSDSCSLEVILQPKINPTEKPEPPAPPCIKYIEIDENGNRSNEEKTFDPNNPPTAPFYCTQTSTAIGPLSLEPEKFVSTLLGLILSASGMIALVLILRSGYQIMTSSGNAEALQEARERITSAIVGLIFIIFSMVILQVIGVDILQIPGFGN